MKSIKRLITLISFCFILCGCEHKEEVPKQTKRVEIVKETYCDRGTLVEGKCQVLETMQPQVECPEGFPYHEETRRCENVISIPAVGQYVCKEGYKLASGKCISEKNFDKVDGKCPEGTNTYNGECKEIKYRDYEYYCPSGTLNGKKCEFGDGRDYISAVCSDETYTLNKTTMLCEKTIYEDTKEREVEKVVEN